MKLLLHSPNSWLSTLLLCFISLSGYGQQQVSGTIRSADDNTPLPGVNVLVKGTTQGTTTDVDGKFTLSAKPTDVLTISFIGYKTTDILVGSQTTINVSIEPDISELEEVVVIGYTSVSNSDLASAVSSVKSEDLIRNATSDIRQTLQGRVAGVQVVNAGGTPGAGARVIIRGIGSFSSSEPLYVIDGIQGGDINSVQPHDIETITVLKDAATTAIYGTGGANGVIVITTKKGKSGKPVLSYEGSMGFSEVTKRYDMLNASEYVDLVEDIQTAGGLTITEKLRSPDVRITRTDWQDAIFRRGSFSQHNLNLSGGTDAIQYTVSSGYTNQESTVLNRDFNRATFGVKLNETFGKFKFMQAIRLKYDQNTGVLGSFGDALRMPPYLPIYDPSNLGGFARADKTTDLNDANNPYNAVYNSDYEGKNLNLNLELSGEVAILKSLSLKSQARISAGNTNNFTFNRPSNGGNFVRNTSDMSEFFSRYYQYILESFLVYDHTFNEDHDVNFMLGTTSNAATIYRDVSLNGSGFTNDNIQNIGLASTKSVTGSNLNTGKARLSYFTRLGYTFRDKYILNVTFRRDYSTVFGENFKWGSFPGVGLGWNISQENFMKNIPLISSMKIRASYGVLGNDNIAPFLTQANVFRGYSNNIVYSFGDNLDFSRGATIANVANPNLKWEETTQYDVGLDLGILSDKLTLNFDYYHRDNQDLLIRTILPLSTGVGEGSGTPNQWVNAASMFNRGFDIAASYNSSFRSFTFNVTLNASRNINEVTSLGTVNDTPLSDGEWVSGVGNATRTDIGHPLGSYFGYVVDRVAVDQNEVDRLNQETAEATNGEETEYHAGLRPGDFIFRDVDGNGFINEDDRTFIGNPAPKWQYGGSINMGFKGIDLELTFMGVADVDVVNGMRYYVDGMSKPFNQTANTLRRWQQEGDVTDMPAAGQNSGRNLSFSTWYVENGSFFRMRNITLGYKLPSSLLNSLTKNVVKSFRVYLTAQNAFTITDYSGYDPEILGQGTQDSDLVFRRGIDNYQLPNPKTYRAGVQITF